MITSTDAALIREVGRDLSREHHAAEAARRAEEEVMRQAMWADIDFAHRALALPPSSPLRTRMLLRAGVRLSRRIEALEPTGRHKRCTRVRALCGFALRVAQAERQPGAL